VEEDIGLETLLVPIAIVTRIKVRPPLFEIFEEKFIVIYACAILARQNKLIEAECTYRERLAEQRNLSTSNTAPITATLKVLADVLKKEGKTNESEALLQPVPLTQ
jgi:hypothetical protein